MLLTNRKADTVLVYTLRVVEILCLFSRADLLHVMFGIRKGKQSYIHLSLRLPCFFTEATVCSYGIDSSFSSAPLRARLCRTS